MSCLLGLQWLRPDDRKTGDQFLHMLLTKIWAELKVCTWKETGSKEHIELFEHHTTNPLCWPQRTKYTSESLKRAIKTRPRVSKWMVDLVLFQKKKYWWTESTQTGWFNGSEGENIQTSKIDQGILNRKLRKAYNGGYEIMVTSRCRNLHWGIESLIHIHWSVQK